MTKKIYKARNSKYTDAQAQIFGEEISSIIKKYGKSTPPLLLKEAKDKDSKLHDYFEWDNSKAGEKYRLQQAREIHQAVVEVVVTEQNKKVEVRSFQSVRSPKGEPIYVTVEDAMTKESYKKQLLKKMYSTLHNLMEMIEIFLKYEK